jgi:putative ABC transport system permease protein
VTRDVAQDVRFAGRMLVKKPGFTVVAVFALGLGIGANATVYSLIYGIFLRPLSYAEPDRLVRLWGQSRDGRQPRLAASVPRFEHIRDRQRSAIAVAADSGNAMTLTGLGDEPQRVLAAAVTANYFDVLGITAQMGRTFTADEEERAQVAVITRSFWINRLGSNPSPIGRRLILDTRPYTIVGIVAPLPASDLGPTEVFLPLPYALSGLSQELRQRGVSYMRITARLKPGVTVEQARAETALLAESYERENREKADSSWREIVIPLREDLTGAVRPAIATLLGAVALVLLIACSNVANLLTARFSTRRREIALRGALGAGGGRIVRLFLVESLLLSVLGALAGLGIAALSLRSLPAVGAINLPLDAALTLAQPVLWTTAAMALATGVLMGVYPAVQAAHPAPASVLKDGGRNVSGGPGQHLVRATLVAGQVALSLVLLVGAALLLSSFVHLRNQDPGFDASRVLTANLALPPARYPSPQAQSRFHDALLEIVRTLPGVRGAALGTGVPLTGADSRAPFARGDGRVPPLNERPLGYTRSATPGYFATLSIPILSGRDFSAHDTAESRQVIVLSQNAAARLFPDTDPLGHTVITGSAGGGIPCEVIAVVGNVRSISLAQPNDVEFYRPLTQRPQPFAQIVVRTEGDPLAIVNAVRGAVRAVDPEMPLNVPTTLAAVTDASLGQRKLQMTLLAVFACVALVLAGVGIFSVVAYVVGQRTNEIGIRLALGARPADVLRLVTWDGLRPIAAGLGAGLFGVFALNRTIATQLYGVSAFDPGTLAVATVTLGAIGLVACIVPARRAMTVDPIVALRTD